MESKNRVSHLLIDTNAVIFGDSLPTLHQWAENIYITPDVLAEIRDEASRARLNLLPYKLKQVFVTEENYTAVTRAARETGDFTVLSKQDMGLIAATLQLSKQYPEETVVAAKATQKGKEKAFGGWITADNIDKLNRDDVDTDSTCKVACFTNDKAMQNVLMAMKLNVVDPKGNIVTKTFKYVRMCHACNTVCKDDKKRFCMQCGNDSLIRVKEFTKADGSVAHSKPRINYNLKGTVYDMPAPKGGKNSVDPIIIESQYQHEQRKHRSTKESMAFTDETIKGSALAMSWKTGQETPNWTRKNPNKPRKRT